MPRASLFSDPTDMYITVFSLIAGGQVAHDVEIRAEERGQVDPRLR